MQIYFYDIFGELINFFQSKNLDKYTNKNYNIFINKENMYYNIFSKMENLTLVKSSHKFNDSEHIIIIKSI
jgi:hypothetical protein